MYKVFRLGTVILICCCVTLTGATKAAAQQWLSLEYFLDAEIESITPFAPEEIEQKLALAESTENPEIQYILARMFDLSIGVKEDKVQAEILYEKAAESGLDKAQLALGIFYNYKGDITKSKKWLTESANNGNPKSIFQLGLIYELGRGVFANIDKAMSYYQQSSDLGWMKATIKLGIYNQIKEKPDFTKAIEYYKKAASQAEKKDDKLKISILLARLYAEIADSQENQEHVFKWTKKAADLGDVESQVNTAKAYMNGIGTELDMDEARVWFERAAYNGDTDAMTMLGYIYSNGIGTEINIEEAIRWYKYSAERGGDEAAWNLGNMYLTGNGVEYNKQEADKWFERAEILRKKKEILKRK